MSDQATTSTGPAPQAGSSQPAQLGLMQVESQNPQGQQRAQTPQGPQMQQGTVKNYESPINKVTFRQKKVMLDFIMAHRELAFTYHLNENLWTQLTNNLNNMKGGVKSCEEWKTVWKLWCNAYKKRKNDLSITLLDLRLITFLESITDNEKKITELKHFANGTTSLLKSCDLFRLVPAVAALAENKDFMKTVNFLKLAEQAEEVYRTKVDYNKNKLSDLILKKQEIEKNINVTTKTLNDNEKNYLSANSEKNEFLKKIRKCIKLTFTRPIS